MRDRPLGGRRSSTYRYRRWADAFPDVDLDGWDLTAATRELVGRYVDSYGPVSRADLVWWTGLPARRIDEAVHGLGDRLVTVSVAGLGDQLLMTPAALASTAAIEPGSPVVSLLPMLDPFTMGYKDRSLFLDPSLDELVIDRGGNVTSVVLVVGCVAGVWDLAGGPNPAIRVLLFEADHPHRARILERAAETAAFWFGGPVPVEQYTSMVPLRHRSGVMRRPLDDAQPRSAAPSTSRPQRTRTAPPGPADPRPCP